jgi:hypothetical protein
MLPKVDANRACASGFLRAEDVAGLHRHGIGGAHPGRVNYGHVRRHALVGHTQRDRVPIGRSAEGEIRAGAGASLERRDARV